MKFSTPKWAVFITSPTLVLLFLLFAFAIWWIGRNCFIGSSVGAKAPWGYCTRKCSFDVWIGAPWYACDSIGACAERTTVQVKSVVAQTKWGNQGREFGEVVVNVRDHCGRPASGAEVIATFSGDFSEQRTAITDNSGVATFRTSTQVQKPSYTFCVDYVDYGTLIYDSSSNVETCDAN